MSFSLVTKAFELKVGNPTRKLILIKLADQANDLGECWPSHNHISRAVECGRKTVLTHIRELEKSGLVAVKEQFREDGSRTSNKYILSLDPPVQNLHTHVEDTPSPCVSFTQGLPPNITQHEPIKVEPITEPNNKAEKFPLFCEKVIEVWSSLFPGNPDIATMRSKLKYANISDEDAATSVSWLIKNPQEVQFANISNMNKGSFVNAINKLFANSKAADASKTKETVMPTDYNLPQRQGPIVQPPEQVYERISSEQLKKNQEETDRLMKAAGMKK